MRALIAIVSCHAFRHRTDGQRATWAKDVEGADVRFFVGRGESKRPDEIALDVNDDYQSLPAKTQAMLKWARGKGYDYIFKCDDDVYVRPERLLASGFQRHDYIGRLRGSSGSYPAPYASGFAYWLSGQSADVIIAEPLNGDVAEDRFVGNTLHKYGISCQADYRYVITSSKRNVRSGMESPRRGNLYIAACEFETPELMQKVHDEWHTRYAQQAHKAVEGTLSRVCIMIKTFLRDGYLKKCVEGLEKNFSDCRYIIVDDGKESREKIALYASLRSRGHACIWLPFDSGFGAKANAALNYLERDYVLIGSDDFDFSPKSVREGVERLQTVLDRVPEVAVASGRVDSRAYEGYIERGEDYIKEIPLTHNDWLKAGEVDYKLCDLTVNYSLIRTKILGPEKIHWHAQWKIGGDHFTFFDDVRKTGGKIAFVPGVNINQLPHMPHWQDARYSTFRARARQALPSFFRMQGIKRYIGFDGRVDTA